MPLFSCLTKKRGTKQRPLVSVSKKDFNRLYAIVAAPLTCIFLIPVLLTFAVQKQASVGFRIPMIRLHHDSHEPTDCGGRSEFVRLSKDGRTWINEAEVPSGKLAPTISGLMENRAERVVYVIVDSDLSYGQFAEFLGKVKGSTSDLHVVVVSGAILREFEERHDLCDFVYPAGEF
jgi:biopolymer transport protein ExbD